MSGHKRDILWSKALKPKLGRGTKHQHSERVTQTGSMLPPQYNLAMLARWQRAGRPHPERLFVEASEQAPHWSAVGE